jgi:hypothetical protein
MKNLIFYRKALLFGMFLILFISNSSKSQSNIAPDSNSYIDSLNPRQNGVNINTSVNILIYFKQSMNPITLTGSHIKVFGSNSGLKSCNISYNSSNKLLTIDPIINFKFGELVFVSLDTGVKTSTGISITPIDYNFTVVTLLGTGTFNLTSNVTTGSSPLPIVSGDFNNDGYPDLAVANTTGYSSSTMLIYINNGSGSFIQTSTLNTDAWPWSIAAADFDNDGDIDLAVTGSKYATLTIYKNNGSGNFTNVAIINLSFAPNHVEAGDINGDGYIDLVTTNDVEDNITIFINTGTGIFSPSSTLSAGDSPNWVSIGDLDNDGNQDLVVVNKFSSNVSIYRNYGNGAFSLSLTLAAGTNAWTGTLLDINNDGLLDFAVCNNSSNDITVFKNMGNWNFTNTGNIAVGTTPIHIISGDFNCDGYQDLATANKNSNNISILLNNGSGGFLQSSTYISGNLPSTIAASDFENDGDIDLAVVNIGSNNVSIFKNINLNPAVPVLISPPNNSYDISLTPTFTWYQVTNAINYNIQISTIQNFGVITDSATVTNTSYTIPSGKLHTALTYFWRVNAKNSYGTGPWSDVWNFSTLITKITTSNSEIPKEFRLYDNYPNPFNPKTVIEFDIPDTRNSFVSVTMKVYNILGVEASTIVNQKLSPGKYKVEFDGQNLPSGVYFYILKTGEFIGKGRMILLK